MVNNIQEVASVSHQIGFKLDLRPSHLSLPPSQRSPASRVVRHLSSLVEVFRHPFWEDIESVFYLFIEINFMEAYCYNWKRFILCIFFYISHLSKCYVHIVMGLNLGKDGDNFLLQPSILQE